MSCGKEFHIFDAEWEKERSYSAERDLGMHKSPLSDDLRENECFSDKGVNKFEMYEGVRLFRALYVSIALLYRRRFGTVKIPMAADTNGWCYCFKTFIEQFRRALGPEMR